jgi:hypothetical protein
MNPDCGPLAYARGYFAERSINPDKVAPRVSKGIKKASNSQVRGVRLILDIQKCFELKIAA